MGVRPYFNNIELIHNHTEICEPIDIPITFQEISGALTYGEAHRC